MHNAYDAYRARIESALIRAMDACPAPEPLRSAMRYSLLAGGKRLRPVLLFAACDASGGDAESALPFACALEMIHTYSLIHDDLPAMDDDALRRGRPTCHVAYGEGMALLAGDGLLSYAFETMLAAADTPRRVRACRVLAAAAGAGGMVAGQCADLASDGHAGGGEASALRLPGQSPDAPPSDADTLLYIHRHKTADMIAGAAEAGFVLGGTDEALAAAGRAFGQALGVAFQIRDDVLDAEGDAALLGKATGMDETRGKLTWVRLYGLPDAREAVRAKTAEALEALSPLGERGGFLRALAQSMTERMS